MFLFIPLLLCVLQASANPDAAMFRGLYGNPLVKLVLFVLLWSVLHHLCAGIRYLMRRAEELKIRDRLVVVMQSEMGRTPTYNAGNGKDHWSIGSVMFLGPGIRGDRVIGATDEKQLHVPLNPRTLAADKDAGIRVRPEHVHQALRQLAGIAEHPLSKKFPLGVTPKDELQGLWV